MKWVWELLTHALPTKFGYAMDVSTALYTSSWPIAILFNAGELDHQKLQHCVLINMLLFPPELFHFIMVSLVGLRSCWLV